MLKTDAIKRKITKINKIKEHKCKQKIQMNSNKSGSYKKKANSNKVVNYKKKQANLKIMLQNVLELIKGNQMQEKKMNL